MQLLNYVQQKKIPQNDIQKYTFLSEKKTSKI